LHKESREKRNPEKQIIQKIYNTNNNKKKKGKLKKTTSLIISIKKVQHFIAILLKLQGLFDICRESLCFLQVGKG
jgi:hypothetical protein